ncbi:acetyl-coenzyme A synthetase-like [Frankliniella occidentalis]|uniref:acetate--CoA ligase n=1 Tax=Frankliniella occidentalis TaxID=133901 RepID=A0A9C6XTC6_FRAOC|nr:acetyl-coenzyme A synthetase-like [Frankliniella occidentalis]
MPMILEVVIAMLACSRIGAVHAITFAGFSSDSLAERILDSKSKLLVTADCVMRGEKLICLKDICDAGESHRHAVNTHTLSAVNLQMRRKRFRRVTCLCREHC